jgi:transposase
VDVASKFLEARIGQHGAAGSFPNTPEGIAGLGAFCQAHQADLLAMEATGGYEQQAFAQLSEQGLSVAILNPRAVRQFAQSMGSLEKTDRIDAGMIAWYAEVKKSRPACLAPQSQLHLRALVTRLRQLTDYAPPSSISSGWSLTARCRVRSKSFWPCWHAKSASSNSVSPRCSTKTRCGESSIRPSAPIKGVADRTVARLMAEMPEIGVLSNKTISKLAGVAPIARDSGQHQGKRAVRAGRAAVREILFIVASVVGRHEPDFIAFQQRLRAAGKPPKVVRIALAHKLLVRLNAKAREVRQRLAALQPHPMALSAGSL